jgi:hypothetical protein
LFSLLFGVCPPKKKNQIHPELSQETHRHELLQSVNFSGMSWRAIVFVRFGLTNTTKILSLHTNVGGKFTRHRIIALKGQDPGNNEYPLLLLAVPNFDAILLRLPVRIY